MKNLDAIQSGHYSFTFNAIDQSSWAKLMYLSGTNTPQNTSTLHLNHYFNVDNAKVTTPTQNLTAVDSYSAEILETHDYYAFGMDMPGRSFNANKYRFGFNGKENDNGIYLDANGSAVNGAQQDYGMRIYNSQLCRFLSVDPLTSSYPWYTPYQFAGNKPINSIDLDGLEEVEVNRKYDENGNPTTTQIIDLPKTPEREKITKEKGRIQINEYQNNDGKTVIKTTYANDLTGNELSAYNLAPNVKDNKMVTINHPKRSGRIHWTLSPMAKAEAEKVVDDVEKRLNRNRKGGIQNYLKS